jgi:hypothetical protein
MIPSLEEAEAEAEDGPWIQALQAQRHSLKPDNGFNDMYQSSSRSREQLMVSFVKVLGVCQKFYTR